MITMERRASLFGAIGAALSVLLGAGCEVVNPGPVDDQYLTLPASQTGFVNGAHERLTRGLGMLAYDNALPAREIFPGGQTGNYGHSVAEQAGSWSWNASYQYGTIQQARWIAEEAIRRFTELGNVTPAIMSQAYVWAGYANRVLGENWCEAIFDGGPLEPGSEYFKRAEQHFTSAIALAPDNNTKYAALAGRAQARMWLENWTGASADAAQVPDNFVWWMEQDFTKSGNGSTRNHIYWAAASMAYRSYSVRFTYYDTYYTQTGDPRTPWRTYGYLSPPQDFCGASLQGYGRVPCTQQMKYKTQDDDIRLSSGKEMRLIEAEALLVQGNFQAAMTKINALRASYTSETTRQPLQPWTASNLVEAWAVLKRERGIELWLEGRRMGDQRRWEPIIGQQKTPGDLELPNFEARSTVFTEYPRGRPLSLGSVTPRALCLNISDTERNTNPHLEPQDGVVG
jgi:hypothetical protein